MACFFAQSTCQTWFQRRSELICNEIVIMLYSKLHVQGHPEGQRPGLGWLHLVSSSGWWAATIATYCLSRMVEHCKSNQDQPNSAPRSSRSPSSSVATHAISVEIYLVHDIFIKTNFMKICMNYCTDVPTYSDTLYSNTPPTITLLAGPKWMVY